MAKWSSERLEQRLGDLRSRLSQGETLEQIASAWGTTKQNVSQFRKRYLGSEGERVATSARERVDSPEPDVESGGEDYSLYARAYRAIIAQERLIQELEAELRNLKYRLYSIQEGGIDGARAKESLKHYLERNQG